MRWPFKKIIGLRQNFNLKLQAQIFISEIMPRIWILLYLGQKYQFKQLMGPLSMLLFSRKTIKVVETESRETIYSVSSDFETNRPRLVLSPRCFQTFSLAIHCNYDILNIIRNHRSIIGSLIQWSGKSKVWFYVHVNQKASKSFVKERWHGVYSTRY